MTWIGGTRELYQPLDYPELEQSWVTVRKCTDRLDKMVGFLDGLDSLPRPPSYLDVASCYSWFVSADVAAGFRRLRAGARPARPTAGPRRLRRRPEPGDDR